MSNDHFIQAATRHLRSSRLLLEEKHFDNAVYLSGYAVECTLKGFLEIFLANSRVRQYSHQITTLHQAVFNKLYILYPQLKSELHFSFEDIEKLAQGHPGRRYWKSDIFTADEAKKIVETADHVYKTRFLH